MANKHLAIIAALLWASAYGWFFAGEVRRWWRGRPQRRAQAAAARAAAVAEYAAWARNIPPSPSRTPIMPPRRPPAIAPPVRSGVVVPFPRRLTTRR